MFTSTITVTGRLAEDPTVLENPWDLASPAARARGDEGNRRLYARWVRFNERRKRHVVGNVAAARELAGWCWSLAGPLLPNTRPAVTNPRISA
jgi:hypothetical protein